jgi:NADH-quinone oxidoreductase subunit J
MNFLTNILDALRSITLLQISFLLAASITVFSAVMVVSAPKMLHAALWLVAALFGVAMLFATLQAGFFAVVQLLIYIGAIAILVIFAIMLTRRVMADEGAQVIDLWYLAMLAAAGVYGGLVYLLRHWSGFQTVAPALEGDGGLVTSLGSALVSPSGYVIPFEVASLLLLAAMVGAIVVAWPKKEEES